MNLMKKSLITMYGLFALIAGSVLLEACSSPEIEQAVRPMAQPLVVAPIKTSSAKQGDQLPKSLAEVTGEASLHNSGSHKQVSIYSKRHR